MIYVFFIGINSKFYEKNQKNGGFENLLSSD